MASREPETGSPDETVILTKDDIRRILEKHLQPELPVRGKTTQFTEWTEKFEFEQYADENGRLVTKSHTSEDRRGIMREECENLLQAASDPINHIAKLEESFSRLVTSRFYVLPDDKERLVDQVYYLFHRRLPSRPAALPESLDRVRDGYFYSEVRSWKNLKVTSTINDNLVKIVILVVAFELYGGGDDSRQTYQFALDDTGEMMSLLSSSYDSSQSEACFIVRAYLWTFWHRMRTLQAHAYFKSFRRGRVISEGDDSYLYMRNFSPCPGITMVKLVRDLAEEGHSRATCSWILELLKSQVVTFGLDFRLIHQRYNAVLGNEPAKCREGSDLPCDGKHPHNCKRFWGAKIEDQSAHDHPHGFELPCLRLPWSRDSFAAVQGPRAVDIAPSRNVKDIQYCLATSKTMAVSHVWSHGQGGRPEVGINTCLHERYCEIAKELSCDSYWMDTTCIPEDHNLRQEAIRQINSVFQTSRAVLVCDRDIMKIDIRDLTMELKESLLAAMVLSEWNTRAWTLLESIKGRQSILLLCKDRKTVDFKQMLRDILSHGRLDVAVFAKHVSHMLPGAYGVMKRTQIEDDLRFPIIGISDVGSWLSYRPASRSGDEFVIWSLLMYPTQPPISKPEAFWKSLVGQNLSTDYLMSSAQRLNANGLRWAPQTPYAVLKDGNGILSSCIKSAKTHLFGQGPRAPTFYRAANGSRTELGRIEADGLWARWWTYELGMRVVSWPNRAQKTRMEEELEKIRSLFVPMYHYGVLLRPIQQHHPMLHFADYDTGFLTQGKLVAVASSRKLIMRRCPSPNFSHTNKSYKWIWRGVYEWPDDVPLPFPQTYKEAWKSVYSELWLG